MRSRESPNRSHALAAKRLLRPSYREYKEISIILLHDKRSTFFVIYMPLCDGEMVAFMFCRRLEFYLRVPCVRKVTYSYFTPLLHTRCVYLRSCGARGDATRRRTHRARHSGRVGVHTLVAVRTGSDHSRNKMALIMMLCERAYTQESWKV